MNRLLCFNGCLAGVWRERQRRPLIFGYVALIMEHRLAGRVRTRRQAIILPGDSASEIATAETRDLSLGGAFLRTDRDLPVNSFVHLKIFPNDYSESEEPIVCSAVVVHRSKSGVGLMFAKLEPLARKALRKLLKWNDKPPKLSLLKTY